MISRTMYRVFDFALKAFFKTETWASMHTRDSVVAHDMAKLMYYSLIEGVCHVVLNEHNKTLFRDTAQKKFVKQYNEYVEHVLSTTRRKR